MESCLFRCHFWPLSRPLRCNCSRTILIPIAAPHCVASSVKRRKRISPAAPAIAMRFTALLLSAAAVIGAMRGCSSAESAPATAAAAPPATAAPVTIAVFEFELEDNSPSADLLKQHTTREDSLHKVTAAAREQLAGSGRYAIVVVDAADDKPVKDGTLRNCEGCEAEIARKLGAQQSMIGVVQRATQTDYYIAVVIRDANTGKVLASQDANFAGSEEGWPTGVRMLIKHQVLPP